MRTTSTRSQSGQIIVGIDGSDSALRAAFWAADEAARHRVPVRLVHSYFQPFLYYPPFAVSTTVNDELVAIAERELKEAAAAVRAAQPGVEVHSEFRYGHPVGTLVDESRTARMIVLGERGRHGFDGMRLGSTPVAVAAHAHCPVAVIRGAAEQDATLPMVVGVDGSPVSDDAVAVAFEEAATRGVRLRAVHAWYDIPDVGSYGLVDLPAHLLRVEDAQHRLLVERIAPWREKYPDVQVDHVVVRLPAREALIEEAAKAQLVVVGSHGRGGFVGMLIGSTSEALLHHSPCPVIVVRPARS